MRDRAVGVILGAGAVSCAMGACGCEARRGVRFLLVLRSCHVTVTCEMLTLSLTMTTCDATRRVLDS